MTTPNRLAVAALALGLAGVPLTAASAHGGRGHHGHHHWRGDHGYRYGPYVHYRYAPTRYVYVRRPVYRRVYYYDDYYPYYPRPYVYSGYRYRYARPGVSVSVGYADGPWSDYGGYWR
jgi:hypothetical protein